MKIYLNLIALLALGTVTAQSINLESDSSRSTTYAQTITASDLTKHLTIYASDEFEGRETGKEGQKKAINYIKNHYKSLGINAAQGGDQYFQPFDLTVKKLPTGSISIGKNTYSNGDQYIAYEAAHGDFSSIIYLGYGIDTEDYSDYTNIDVTDKVILIKRGQPESMIDSDWGKLTEGLALKKAAAIKHGASQIIYVDQENYDNSRRRFDYMQKNNSGRMNIKALEGENIATLFFNDQLAKELFEGIESSTPKKINVKLSLHIESEDQIVQTENVVAFIPGTEFPEEYVVISSHLDHIGVTASGEINNGADDDGSGTVSLLEIAEAFKTAANEGHGPKRSLVFLHVTGEEKGLLGSRYYTDVAPLFPLNQTIADLNIDMVGRIDPKRNGDRNYIYLIGSDKLSTELHEISEAVNKEFSHIELDYTYNDENDPNRFYYRSDHYNFAKNNIPIIFYFNGTHADYHKPSDTVDKINFDLLENRTRLVFHTAWEVANREKAIVADKAK